MATINKSDKKKILALIEKVKRLSESGDRGEKINAQEMLDKLLKKYNLKKFELMQKPKKRTFKLQNFKDCLAIMTHCILDTVEDISIEGLDRKREVYCKLTDEQYIDVCEKFNHYYPIYEIQVKKHDKQRGALLKAFLIKNNLGISSSEEEEEADDICEIKEMMSGVEENRYSKKDLKQLQA